MTNGRRLNAICAFGLLIVSMSDARAAGFAISEQSVVGVGYGFAGLSANPEDASVINYNPAGLSFLERPEVVNAIHALNITAKYTDAGSLSPAGPPFPLSGGSGGNPIGLNWVPNAYFAAKWNSRIAFGLGITSPLGLKTTYPSDWLGRYHATTSDIKTININPSVAFQAGDAGSIGVGLNMQYFKASLENALDLGAACFGSPFGPTNCAAAGILPGTRDGFVSIKGDSWGFGANIGWMVPLGGGSYIGAAYRGPIKHKLSGNARFTLPSFPAPFSALTASIQDTDAKADFTSPAMLSASFKAQVSPRLAILGDVTLTQWSRLQELRIRFANGTPDAVTPEHWKNVSRVGLGIGYDVDSTMRLRAGVSYEPSTIPDPYRTARVPDNVQKFVGGGLGYRISPSHHVDLAYGHVFVKDAPVDNSVAGPGTLRGSYKIRADIFSAQYRMLF